MKKFLLTTMMAALMVCAAGCGNNAEDNNAGATEAGNTAATVTPVPTQEPEKENASDADVVADTSVNEGEFKAGAYAGNASYASGEFSMSWVFTANFLADGTFTLINDSGEEKGAGTYALTEQCYTMTYSDDRTGTFVVQADGNLKVTSDLPYGQASISPDMVGGIVLTYSGEAAEAGSSEQTPAEDTAKEPEADTTTAEGYSMVAGNYVASYTKESAMAGTVVYNYSATVGEDGTFSYSVSFAMGDTTYDGSAASGTYTLEGTKFVFTDSEGNVTEGTVTAENTLVISLSASAMAKTPYEVTFVPAQ